MVVLCGKNQKDKTFLHIEYDKEKARAYLEKEFGWQYYGGHHLENRIPLFSQYLCSKKFGMDFRNNTAAQARLGKSAVKKHGFPTANLRILNAPYLNIFSSD